MPKLGLQMTLWTIFIAVLIFWPAGTLNYPGGWVFVAFFGIGGSAITFWLAKHNPRLLRERLSSPVQRNQKPWDRVFLSLFSLAFVGWLIFMSRDAGRTGFQAVAPWFQVLGGLALLIYGLGAWWAFRANTFAAPVVKVQADQKVIDTGPYALVRHPMYASGLFLFLGLPLVLGSWRGLALAVFFILGIAWRAVREERTLRAELPGYAEYADRVRYRFIPHIW